MATGTRLSAALWTGGWPRACASGVSLVAAPVAAHATTAALAARERKRRRIAQVLHTQLLQPGGQALLDHRLGQGLAVFAVLQLQHCADIVLHRKIV